jgi:hypothetical protein
MSHGASLLSQLKAQPGSLVDGIGVQMYVVQPLNDGGGILNYNVARNVITVVP